VRTSRRVAIKELQREFGQEAVAPFDREQCATQVFNQGFEND
jgi:hypothetical protein